jgi:hypothetical protein
MGQVHGQIEPAVRVERVGSFTSPSIFAYFLLAQPRDSLQEGLSQEPYEHIKFSPDA